MSYQSYSKRRSGFISDNSSYDIDNRLGHSGVRNDAYKNKFDDIISDVYEKETEYTRGTT